ncbi:MAG: PLP-dependent cysteine synthase family protein [Planctomycetes bacterium]|nr:PLP-dependent cysteine synthase family protein [Planctomycetota bacterium]
MHGRANASARALLGAIGNTPFVEIDGFPELSRGTRLFGKLEGSNPGGSIKDRPVANMLRAAIAGGQLAGGRRLLDSTSGNAGIAYALYGAALGVPITLVVPANASRERLDRIAAHGAELILTDPLEGYDFALREAARLARENPARYWHCDQYSNPENWRAHESWTGAEIERDALAATGAVPDAFVGGVGTGGTLTGVARRLRRSNPALYVAAAIPETFPGIEGLKPLGAPEDVVPAILDLDLIDERIPMTLDRALDVCRALAARGIYAGPSAGAFVAAALELAARGRYKTIVTVLSDAGERYGSTGMWRYGTTHESSPA